MPCLAFAYNPATGPIIQVAILEFGFAPSPHNLAPLRVYGALIDTGASCTCISAKVCSDLSLMPIGKQSVAGVHGKSATNLYQFQVGILFGQSHVSRAAGTVGPNWSLHQTIGFEVIPQASFDVLLGRDIICLGALSMSFDGHGTFSL